MKARQEFTDRTTEASFRSFYGGFLTPKEIREVIDGKDMWLTADEVNSRVESKLLGATTAEDETAPVKRRGRPAKG